MPVKSVENLTVDSVYISEKYPEQGAELLGHFGDPSKIPYLNWCFMITSRTGEGD